MSARNAARFLFAFAILSLAASVAAQTATAPIAVGANPTGIAVNPVTNKIYVANQASNTVTVIDGKTNATITVPVGTSPTHIAVNPERNRIFVSNLVSASVSIIDGATDAVITTLATGGSGWTAVNPHTDRAYVLRYGNGDEVNVLQGDTYALTSATRAYTPVALAINPVNNYLYIVHQTTGDIVAMDMTNTVPYPPRVCPNGTGGIRPFDPNEAAPPPCINVPDTPVGVAVNPRTNTVYAVSSSATGQISVINGTNHTFTSLTPPGAGNVAKAIAVNPVTNRIYAAFSSAVVIVDGATNAMTVIPAGSAGSGPVAVGINVLTNKIYVPSADGMLIVINGDDNTFSTLAIPTGSTAVAVNPITNKTYILGSAVVAVDGSPSDTAHAMPIVTSIQPLPGNSTASSGSITLNVSNTFTPAALAATRKVYYQIDGHEGPWQVASGSGPYTATFSGLALGSHVIRAFATNGLDAPSINTHPQHNPIIGNIASYTFTVTSTSPPQISMSPASLDFGRQSMGTSSVPRTVTITNTGGATLTISSIAVSSQFTQGNDCTALAAGASCTVTVTFRPAVAAGALNSTATVSGTLTATSNAASGSNTASLGGIAEKSLVAHYYQSILRRVPDAGGRAFWAAEAQRMQDAGANVNETWRAMAMSFYFGAEYALLNRDNTAFLTDLYNTFFNRAPDGGGMTFWLGQMGAGMPREAVLVAFMFSPEFANFTQAIFGAPSVRAEIDMVMDFYRGLLSRLPDAGGLAFYLRQFRAAQCQGAGAVYAQVEAITNGFINGQEYANRNRSTAQFVADMYNAFVRRGADLEGFRFYVNQIDTGAKSRDRVRQDFISSPEFNARVQAVVGQPCMQ